MRVLYKKTPITITLEGWEVGMRPIPFVKLLNQKVGLRLSLAKKLKDNLMNNNEAFEIIIKDESTAKKIVDELTDLKIKCKISHKD